jgi:hypothetical protein
MGDEFVRSENQFGPSDSDRETLIWSWKEKQAVRLGRTHEMKYAHEHIKAFKKKTKDANERIAQKVSGL